MTKEDLKKNGYFDIRFWVTVVVVLLGWAVTFGMLKEKITTQGKMVEKIQTNYNTIPERLSGMEQVGFLCGHHVIIVQL